MMQAQLNSNCKTQTPKFIQINNSLEENKQANLFKKKCTDVKKYSSDNLFVAWSKSAM